jgi:hypothetical protein
LIPFAARYKMTVANLPPVAGRIYEGEAEASRGMSWRKTSIRPSFGLARPPVPEGWERRRAGINMPISIGMGFPASEISPTVGSPPVLDPDTAEGK